MKLGNLSFAISILLIFFNFTYLGSQEKVNLQDLQPTFEEETDTTDLEKDSQISKIKSTTVVASEKFKSPGIPTIAVTQSV